jgi:hypothetical protein
VQGYVFVAQGDITRLAADAVAFSAAADFEPTGHLYSAFRANVSGFADWFASLRTRVGTGHPGDTHWLPPDAPDRPYGVAAVVAAGKAGEGEQQAGAAVHSAIDTAVRELRGAGRSGRLLVALPAFRAGKEADRGAVLASARAQLRAAREAIDVQPDVDVALVTYTPVLHQAFLTARRDVRANPDDDPPPEGLERALELGECVLFVGAGLSQAAGLPGWPALARRLADELGIELGRRTDYLDVAQWYREKFGAEALGRVIRETFDASATHVLPTLTHYLLLALAVRYVVTTNYDRLIEEALLALKRYPVRVVSAADVARTGGRVGVYVVKLHGDVGRPEEVVLGRDDFETFLQDRPALSALLEALLLNQTFFFVGYGLRDPNFRQIFGRIAQMLRDAKRPAFATTFEAGGVEKYLQRQWHAKQLTLVPIRGADHAEQERQFVRWLDRLAERVVLQTPARFLAPDTDLSPRLDEVRQRLNDEIGRLVAQAGLDKDYDCADAEHLIAVLRFLSHHGWRPAGDGELCTLWERLAECTDDPVRRREMLVEALAAAERFADAQRIRERLDSSD